MAMNSHSDETNISDAQSAKTEARRNVLKMAAAGMPMVLTMKASASGALISQLRCSFTLGVRQRMLVDPDGAVWVNTRNIAYDPTKGLYDDDIAAFKADGIAFAAGSAPSQFRPLECASSGDDDGSGGKGKGGDDDDDDDDDDGWTDCGYNYYRLGQNVTITPADYLNGSTWNIGSNKKGLYLELTRQYALSGAMGANWPGVSCLSSILIYLGQL